MESAQIASSAGSIHTMADRIAAWAEDHPEASEYCLGDEPEARELLVLIAATFKVTARGTSSMNSGVSIKAPLSAARLWLPIRIWLGSATDIMRASSTVTSPTMKLWLSGAPPHCWAYSK